MLQISKTKKGFTLVELTISIALFAVLFGMGATVLGNFNVTQALRAGGDRLVQAFREAHTNAMAQSQDSAWGVYMNTAAEPDHFVVFKGNSYAARDTSFDQINEFHKSVIFQNINLNGGGNEIIFSKRSGFTNDYGSISLQAKNDQFDIDVNGLGLADFNF